MRRRSKVDSNQPQIVNQIRAMGATVQHLHTVGQGCPDILVGFRGHNFLFEIKDGSLPPSKRRLTEDQIAWHTQWRGSVHVFGHAHEVAEFLARVKSKTPEEFPPCLTRC